MLSVTEYKVRMGCLHDTVTHLPLSLFQRLVDAVHAVSISGSWHRNVDLELTINEILRQRNPKGI
jgi:hypothetical protein